MRQARKTADLQDRQRFMLDPRTLDPAYSGYIVQTETRRRNTASKTFQLAVSKSPLFRFASDFYPDHAFFGLRNRLPE
jgi:hypothetical protein